jgi:sucrose phosphorylase
VDNISYFGSGADEAQMVYNFALPPLVLHTFRNGNAGVLTQWARSLALPSKQTTFFNFLASHDGIGLNPARGILPESDVFKLAEGTLARGGFINYKHMPDGSQVPYEMNINYLDALCEITEDRKQNTEVRSRPAQSAGSQHSALSTQHSKDKVDAKRMLAAHAIALALQGVPGIFFHSMFGSRGWPDGVQQHGYNRAINRQKLTLDALELELAEPGSLRRTVFDGMTAMLRARATCRAFDPFGEQQVLDLGPEAFAVLRMTERNANFKDRAVCLVNVTNDDIFLNVDWRSMLGTRHAIHNLITGTKFNVHGPSLMLRPYQVMWATVGM